MKAIPALTALFLSAFALPLFAAGENCTLQFRPTPEETAFAAVGAPLKVADRRCLDDFLVIPETQKLKAVTLPKGQYPALNKTRDTLAFDLTSVSGDTVSDCALCDPLLWLEVVKLNDRAALCVRSKLNVRSCAPAGAAKFAVINKPRLEENVCTPALVYFGREGNNLRFAVSDCAGTGKPSLNYDLTYGRVIRFLDEQFEVLNADNQGIYFRRLPQTGEKADGLR